MDNNPIVILEDSAFFKKGQILDEYVSNEDGVFVENKFIDRNKYAVLNEKLTTSEEKEIKNIIRQQLKLLFYNLYTKQSFLIGNL